MMPNAKHTAGYALMLALCGSMMLSNMAYAQDARIVINADVIKNHISKFIYGSNIEDVNHEIYGGFYDQKIFGESFEEPSTGVNYNQWRRYCGYWLAEDGYLSIIPGRNTTRVALMRTEQHIGVEPDHSAKMIYQPLNLTDGLVEADIKFLQQKGNIGGLLVRVSNAGIGNDAFNGYEISISADGKRVILGKHRNNFEFLKDAPAQFDPQQWTKLGVSLKGNLISININGTEVLSYEDKQQPLKGGKIGLRTWHSALGFKNVRVNGKVLNLFNKPDEQISYNWDILATQGVKATWTVDSTKAFNGKRAQTVSNVSGIGRVGVINRGLNRWGIAVQKGKTLQGRLYLKSAALGGPVTVALENADGTKTYAVQKLQGIISAWKKYTFNFTPSQTDANARLSISIQNKGKIWIDQVVLMNTKQNRYKGLPIRADIGNAIVNEGVRFLRYAGTMVNAPGYRFKNMIGAPDKRPPYTGHWNAHSTNGFGIEEFLQYCEVTGIEPVIAINIYETPQDVADMMEYMKGSITTKYGKLRAANGHPKPYAIKYIEIGNEEVIFNGDNEQDYQFYINRFNLLYDAMRAKFPAVKFIHSAWWRPESKNMELVFNALNGKAAYWDLHVGGDDPNAGVDTEKQLTLMKKLFDRLDPKTTMKVAVFEENGSKHGIQRALGHATNLNAIRRFGDFVLASCPANALEPYLQNDNDWNQGQIFFTADKVWGMPPFYSQQMQSNNHQPLRVEEKVDGRLDVTAAKSEDGKTLILYVVNTEEQAKNTTININGFTGSKPTVQTLTLSGPLNGVNTLTEPKKYSPVKKTATLAGSSPGYVFPAHSYTVLRFSR